MRSSYFPQGTPESVGIPSGEIVRLLDAMERENVQLNSLMILRHGILCAQGWYAPYGPEKLHTLHSFTKTICSTAIGFLVTEGKISLDDRVIDFFPEETPEEPSENLKEMRIRHLLSMSGGHETEPPRKTDNWAYDFLHHEVKRKPGTYFVYNTMGTYMLSAVIYKVTGMNFTAYLKPRLFEPLGISEWYCSTCPKGIEHGGGGMCLKTEDMAKITQLYLQKGFWNGKQLIPTQWIEEASSSHIVQAEGWYPVINAGMEDYFSGYGYQIWMNSVPTGYRFDGMYAQLGIVLPKYDMAIVTTAATCRIYKVLNTIWRILLPAVYEEPIEENEEEYQKLLSRLQSLQIPWGKASGHSFLEKEISGHPVVLPRNEYSLLPERVRLFGGRSHRDPEQKGLKEMVFSFEPDQKATLRFREWGKETVLPLGYGEEKLEGMVDLQNLEKVVLGSYCWEEDQVLRIDLLHIHSVYHRIIRLKFGAEKKVQIEFSELPNDIDPPVNMNYVPQKTFEGDWF